MLIFECNHGVPGNTVGVGSGQRSRGVLDSDQQIGFQVIYVLKYMSWVTFRKSRIYSNCSSRSSLCYFLSYMHSFSSICQNHRSINFIRCSLWFLPVSYSWDQAPEDRGCLLGIIRNHGFCACVMQKNHLFKESFKPVLALT